MFKKFTIILLLIMGFVIIDNVSAECVTGNGMSYYDIKFVTNGGNELENMELCASCGDFLVAQLPTPTKDDYNFLGWYADENLTIPINSVADDWDQTVVQYEYDNENCQTNKMNVTLYAKWENNNCPQIGGASTVFLFETNGGDKIDNISICDTCADALTAWDSTTLPNPTKDGYTFEGWYADKDLTIKIESIKDENIKFDEKYDENECSDGSRYTTLYAKWGEISAKSNDEASTADVDNTGKNISMFLTIISGLLIISGTVMYIVNLNSKKKN